ncbi:uncharacterized protein LOC124352907 [Homalodisca vitripennis]|uniref:uncharacterized protein LOC124352907 n=1 Tax=Homalodisca vitripennis TaxID=197043 RepID=UPI001EEBF62E|nr:uncharacterized protein LOC124352907 [Homalodisca vitripennis]
MKIGLVYGVLLYVCLAEIFTTAQIQGDDGWNTMMDSVMDNNIVMPIGDGQSSGNNNGDVFSDILSRSVIGRKKKRRKRRKNRYRSYGVRHTGESAVKLILFVLWFLYYS